MNIINKFTLRTLRKNKVRTLITIIGIILSVSMITAVTTFISSLRNYLIESNIAENGDWHGAIFHLNKEEVDQLKSDEEVTGYGVGQNIGYAYGNTLNESKPYIFVFGISEGFTDTLPVKLVEGRLPQNSSEIILPKHLQTNGGVTYQLGEELSLEMGDRKWNGLQLYQMTGLLTAKENEVPEQLVIRETNRYSIVGFYERPSFESFSAPGYTALTISNTKEADSYDVYFKLNKPKNIYTFIENKFPKKEATYNNNYLRLLNASNNSTYNRVLYGLASILIIIIMFGSISLIYNAFSISVSERMKQFGLISSIGATKKQILNSVLFEALSLCVIGIPLGILSGILGIGVTLKLTGDLFLTFMSGEVMLTLSVSVGSVVIAAVIGVITVLISALIPARRAVKVPAIEAIRQTADINIKAKKVKTSKLTYKLFGFEGMIALKNFKRNRRKYRATVVSLFLSVVLFISASSFCQYLMKGVTRVVDNRDYDISYLYDPNTSRGIAFKEFMKTMNSIEGITESNYMYSVYSDLIIDKKYVSQDYLQYMKENSGDSADISNGEKMDFFSILYFIEDAAYDKYVSEQGYPMVNGDRPIAIAMDAVKFYNPNTGRYHTYRMLNKNNLDLNLLIEKSFEDYSKVSTYTDEAGNVFYEYQDMKGETYTYPREEVTTNVPIHIGEVTDTGPVGVGTYYGNTITLLFPISAREAIIGTNEFDQPVSMYFKTTDHKEVFNKLYKTLEDLKLPTQSLYDSLEFEENDRAMVTVISIFSYGFIILISLIAAANVFNTISTNIALRRVEFAMLRSVGMTDRGFHKMMNYECLLYGIKGLLYGIPVAIVITYYIYRNVIKGLEMPFFLPWDSILIAIGSVFAVVFATMVFSMSKIKRENTIDALKNENI
jgi:putative ABC transport system permease protein